MTGITDRLRKASNAFAEHSAKCAVCNDPENHLKLCDLGEKLMQEFYDALRESAREGQKGERDAGR